MRHDCQVILRITSVIVSPISGSPISSPSATTMALPTTPSEMKPSIRAWYPSESLARAEPDESRDLVPHEADRPGGCECPQVVERLRVDQTLDRLHECEARAEEDRRHDEVAGCLLAPLAPEEERDPERHRGQCVAEVVDEIRQQGDAVARHEQSDLHERREQEHGEGDRDRSDACPRPDDRRIDETVAVAVIGAQRSVSR